MGLGCKSDSLTQFTAADKRGQNSEPQDRGGCDGAARVGQDHGIGFQDWGGAAKQTVVKAISGEGHRTKRMCSEIQKMNLWPVGTKKIGWTFQLRLNAFFLFS